MLACLVVLCSGDYAGGLGERGRRGGTHEGEEVLARAPAGRERLRGVSRRVST